MHDLDHLLGEVEGVLDTERNLLRLGAFEGLSDLARRKEQLISHIAGHMDPASSAILQRVRAKAQVNLALFAAAQSGLRAAQDRLDAIRRGASTLQTYDSNGRATAFVSPVARHERRA